MAALARKHVRWRCGLRHARRTGGIGIESRNIQATHL